MNTATIGRRGLAIVLAAFAFFGAAMIAAADDPPPGTVYLEDFFPGRSYQTASIDERTPDISRSGDVWHLVTGTFGTVSGNYRAYEYTPGAAAHTNLGDSIAKVYRARIWMPAESIISQAEGGIQVRENAAGTEYFYIGFHGSMFSIADPDPRPPDERHYLGGVAAGILLVNLPSGAFPILTDEGYYADIEVYDDGAAMVVYLNGVNVFGTVAIPWYAGNTYFGLSGGDHFGIVDGVSHVYVAASNGLTPLPTSTFTATPTYTQTITPTPTCTPSPTRSPGPTFTATSYVRYYDVNTITHRSRTATPTPTRAVRSFGTAVVYKPSTATPTTTPIMIRRNTYPY